ncbi:MAG: hemolysin family protein [Bryobacteraceae bacterium]
MTVLLMLVLLILLNALFVAAEFAAVGAPRTAIERRAAQGHPLARLAASVLRDPRRQDQYIATAQLGITFASLGLGMYGEHVVAAWLAGWFEALGPEAWLARHAVASVVAVGLLTYVHIVFGEMIPKTLALQRAEKTILWITPPMMWMKAALYPLVLLLNTAGNAVLRRMGIDRREVSRQSYYTPEELELIIEESQEGGVLRDDAGRVLKGLFRFSELTAGEAMMPRVRVTGIPLGAHSSEIRRILKRSPHTRYPIFRESLDDIVGIIHVKDLLPLLIHDRSLAVEETRPVPFVPQTSSLDVVLAAMRRETSQIAVVMDEYGGTAGVVTLEDLFEEVVGDVDEEATERPEIQIDAEGRLMVSGTVRLNEVGQTLGIELEHEEVDTVSGLVLLLLDRPPEVGDAVVYEGVRFDVAEVEKHGVKTSLVTLIPGDAESGGPRRDAPDSDEG